MQPIASALDLYFDRVVVIGLHRIPDFYRRMGIDWFGWSNTEAPIELFPAIDCRRVNPPPYWTDIPALWACGESHRQVICRALNDGLNSICILEDDAAFTPEAAEILPKFLRDLPGDWDGAMLGGQVSVHDGKTAPITPRVSRCVQVERLHAYALSRSGMQKFHDILCENSNTPNDYRWGDAQEDGRLTVYRCEPFIAYQAEGRSAISGRIEANRIWDDRVDTRMRKVEDIPVISLVCPFPIMERLRHDGIITNGGESPPLLAVMEPGRVEAGEMRIAETMLAMDPCNRENVVRALRGDAAFHRSSALVLWHPREAIPFPGAPVIRTETLSDAIGQIGKARAQRVAVE